MGNKPQEGSKSSRNIEGRTEESLNAADMLYRDVFIREYIKDFNGGMALVRMGVTNLHTARTKASVFLREPYVARKLDETVRTLQMTDVVSRGQVMAAMWKEANTSSNMCSTRVAALAHLGKMLKMGEATVETKAAPMNVMVVPVMSETDWSAQVAKAQELLKAAAATQT